MKIMNRIPLCLALSFGPLLSSLYSIDNPHFYRASYWWGEPRLEKPWLSTIDISIGAGSTHQSRDRHNHKTTLFNVYGFHNMQALGINVPGLDPSNPLDQLLIDLAALPARTTFAQLQFSGAFSIVEATINAYQNFCSGFFLQTYLPLRRIKVSEIDYIDRSPVVGSPNKNTPPWREFLDQLPAILARYDISLAGQNEFGAGDFSLLVGWAHNHQETEILDFIDVSATIGVLFPTGRKANVDKPFTLPLGYNGHYAIPLKFDVSLGLWEWFTWGVHMGALFFFKRDRDVRIKTDPAQNGFIKLAKINAEFDQGTIWDIATFVKADHIFRGISLLFGYTFNKQERDTIDCCARSFSSSIANNDEQLKTWHMHTLHFLLEYDFSRTACDKLPRIGFFYNRVVGGRRIFDTNIKAAYMGIDLAWNF